MQNGRGRGYEIQKYRGQLALVYRDATGTRRRHTLGTADAREAEIRAPGLFTEITRSRTNRVADLWTAYLNDRRGRAIVPTMLHTWKALERRFGRKAPDQITVADCRAHTEARREAGIKDGTIHTELGHLRMVLVWAEKQGLIPRALSIERPSKPKPKERHLTREQIRAVIDAAGFAHVRTFITLAIATGGRSAALLGLTWDRVDLEGRLIDLRDPGMTQPHKGRAVVPINDMLHRELVKAKSAALSPFVVEWAGKRVTSVKGGVTSVGNLAGIPNVTVHLFRHSAAVHMAERGIPMEEIAQFLGHSDVNVTRRVYARFSPNYLRRAAEALDYD